MSFAMFSCSEMKQEPNVLRVTDENYSDWASLVQLNEVIPFEENDSSLLSIETKCLVGKERILFSDYATKKVFAFDKRGKYLFSVGNNGGAKSEVIGSSDVVFNQNQSAIEILDKKGVAVYSSDDGRFLERKEIDKSGNGIQSFIGIENGGYLAFEPFADYSISLCDDSHGKMGLRKRDGYQMVFPRFWSCGGNLLVIPDYGFFTVDTYAGGLLRPKYIIDLGNKSLPHSYIKEKYSEFSKTDAMKEYYKCIMAAMENNLYFYALVVGPAQTYYDLFYNKQTDKLYLGPKDSKTAMMIVDMDSEAVYGIIHMDQLARDSYLYQSLSKYEGKKNPVLIKFSLKK